MHLPTLLLQQHCVLYMGSWRGVLMQHQDLPSSLQPFLANALCYILVSSRQFWRLALGQVQSLLNSNQT